MNNLKNIENEGINEINSLFSQDKLTEAHLKALNLARYNLGFGNLKSSIVFIGLEPAGVWDLDSLLDYYLNSLASSIEETNGKYYTLNNFDFHREMGILENINGKEKFKYGAKEPIKPSCTWAKMKKFLSYISENLDIETDSFFTNDNANFNIGNIMMLELYPFPLNKKSNYNEVYQISRKKVEQSNIFIERRNVILDIIENSEDKTFIFYGKDFLDDKAIYNRLNEMSKTEPKITRIDFNNKLTLDVPVFLTKGNSKVIIIPHLANAFYDSAFDEIANILEETK